MKESQAFKSVWIPWMRRALQLAELADGKTSPNPLVGAVVLDEGGRLVGEGFHSKAGAPHAEVGALAQAGIRAKGGSLIVTLEPCCHQGRTPPCTEAVLESGIKKVVVALQDPDPRVSGEGLSRLRTAGLEVISGVLEDEAAYQNRAFIFRVCNGRPWGILKWAMSLDGRTSLPNGDSKWVSGPESRSWVHHLRSKCDAVIVGGGTVRFDNPLLTSRGLCEPEPLRVVLTRSLQLPKDAQLWDTEVAKTLIAFEKKSEVLNLETFPKGPERLALKASCPVELLKELAKKDCNRILWECGPALATEAIQKGCVQELAVVLAPKLMGGTEARTPLLDLGFNSMDQVSLLQQGSIQKLGSDWLITFLCPDLQN